MQNDLMFGDSDSKSECDDIDNPGTTSPNIMPKF